MTGGARGGQWCLPFGGVLDDRRDERVRASSRNNQPTPPPATRPPKERVERYEKKLTRAALDDERARSRPGTDLNVAAANRFIAAAIPELTPAQRQALRRPAGGEGRQAGGGKRGADGEGGGGSGGKRAKESKDADLSEILAAAAGDGDS
jgi:hypothetical protein